VLRTIPPEGEGTRLVAHGGDSLYTFVPAEIFTAWLDLHFIFEWLEAKSAYVVGAVPAHTTNTGPGCGKTLSHRIGALHGLPVMAVLSYFTALAVIAWQPMRKDNPESRKEVRSG
jgi:hypothetical protein